MCGIGGIISSLNTQAKQQTLEKMSVALAHRGPDGNGFFSDESVGLVHARLAIIDVTSSGNQPLYNEDRSLVLICNGEIYNYRSIRADLEAKGHRFSSNSDCEVIVHLYEEYRHEPELIFNKLTGMFAFAIWDTVSKTLLVARDRLGIKPLYYYKDAHQFVFASEVKGVVGGLDRNPAIDHTSLYELFLLGSIPGPNTLYQDIKCLPPASYALVAANGDYSERTYWSINSGLGKWRSQQEVNEAVDALLVDVVKDHLVADVLVGTFLSAGIDSSLITAIACQHQPGIYSFTAAFPGEAEDEGAISSQTASKLNTTHLSYPVENSFFDGFKSHFKDIDQPFAVSSALSLSRISRMAREKVKVVLSGDGADELFGGYDHRHVAMTLPSFLTPVPAKYRNVFLRTAAVLTGRQSLTTLAKVLNIPQASKYLGKLQIMTPEDIQALLSPEFNAKIDIQRYERNIASHFDAFDDGEEMNRLLYVDVKTTLVDEMLTKCDRMTMANGIEGRVPFLDHRMVELAFTIPARFKRNDTFGKLPLRYAVEKRLGHSLAFRKKTGFNSPLKSWMSKDADTYNFVLNQVKEAKLLSLFSSRTLDTYAADVRNIDQSTAFTIASVNEYFKQ